VIDYTQEDFTKTGEHYDAVIDNVGNRSLSECRRLLTPNGRYVMIGGGGMNEQGLFGLMLRPVKAMIMSPFISQKMGMMMAQANQKDLTILGELIASGTIKPVIDRTYKFSELPDAIRYVEAGHARGKVVVVVEQSSANVR
jgi:NADPH:quinone reductase-like Zn-dependent oxidoreductase